MLHCLQCCFIAYSVADCSRNDCDGNRGTAVAKSNEIYYSDFIRIMKPRFIRINSRQSWHSGRNRCDCNPQNTRWESHDGRVCGMGQCRVAPPGGRAGGRRASPLPARPPYSSPPQPPSVPLPLSVRRPRVAAWASTAWSVLAQSYDRSEPIVGGGEAPSWRGVDIDCLGSQPWRNPPSSL